MFWCEDIERGVYQLIPPHIQITRKSSRVSCNGSVRLRIGNEYEHRILKSIRSLVLLTVLPLPNVLALSAVESLSGQCRAYVSGILLSEH